MGIATSADGIGQQHAVQPAVNNAITGSQRDATTVHDKGGQGVLGFHIDGFWIGRCVTERLHDQVGREAETGQILEFVTGHRPSGILRADRGHPGFTVLSGSHTLHAAGSTHHLLSQSKSFVGRLWCH